MLYRKFLKRFLDIILSFAGIIILSPVMLATAFLVRLKLGTPVIFRQKRPGKDGGIFEMYKFRSMTDKKGRDGSLLSDEMRLTSFGKNLRTASLDELPELFNILRGDMSIVGPRPLLVSYLPLYNEEQKHRHDVRPGLTGLAQVRGRNALDWEEKFRLDVMYAGNVTFALDLWIMMETIRVVLKRDGIHADGEATMTAFDGNGEQL